MAANKVYQSCLVVVIILICSGSNIRARYVQHFDISGIFEMYSILEDHSGTVSKRINPQIGIHFREAYKFAIMRLNKKNLLNGLQLKGAYWCSDSESLFKNILHDGLLKASLFVSPLEPINVFKISLLSDPLSLPTISIMGSYLRKAKDEQKYHFDAAMPDGFRISAAVAVIEKLKWNYITIISSSGKSGEGVAIEFTEQVSKLRICDAASVTLPSEPTTPDYLEAVRLANTTSANGLVLVTDVKDSKGIVLALKRLAIKDRFQILALSGFTNYKEITGDNEEFLEGAISIEHGTVENQEFEDYFLSLNPQNRKDTPFLDFWEDTFRCSLNISGTKAGRFCTEQEKLQPGQGYYTNTPVHLVMNSVYSFAEGIRSYIEQKCAKHTINKTCKIPAINDITKREEYFDTLRRFLINNSFSDHSINIKDPISGYDPTIARFDILQFVRTRNNHLNIKLGNWTLNRNEAGDSSLFSDSKRINGTLYLESNIGWTQNRALAVSSCRLPCHVGERRVVHPDSKLRRCCLQCIKCGPNDITVDNICLNCGDDKKPDNLRKRCVSLTVRYFGNEETEKNSVRAYVGLGGFGVIVTLFVLGVFVRFQDNNLVSSSGRDLPFVILFGICLLFLTPVTFLLPPSQYLCAVQEMIPGIALCMCYSPLFFKVNHIYRISRNVKTSPAKPQSNNFQSHRYVLTSIIGVQVLFGIVWVVGKTKKISKFYHKDEGYVVQSCNHQAVLFILNLILSLVFVCSCTWYAFKTRNFPKHHHETKYIGLTMYLSCFIWAVFLPSYFVATDNFAFIHEHLICATWILAGFVTLVGLFGQKVQILLIPTQAQKQRHNSQLSNKEEDPNQFKMTSYKLNTLSLQRFPSKTAERSRFGSQIGEF